jgi:hypothetical protein
MQDNHCYSSSRVYKQLHSTRYEDLIEYINSLPYNPSPDIFGLGQNASIIYGQQQARDL